MRRPGTKVSKSSIFFAPSEPGPVLGGLGLQVRSRPLPSAGSQSAHLCMETDAQAAAGEVVEPTEAGQGSFWRGCPTVLARGQAESPKA